MSITLQKIAGAVLFSLIVVMGLNLLVDGLMKKPVEPHREPIAAVSPASPAQAPAGVPVAEEKPLPERLAAASVEKGQTEAKKCQSCHNFNPGGATKIGPDLAGVVGRPKASVAGFDYSGALKKLGGTWSYDDLDKWLAKPGAFAPGTKMTFAGLPDGAERADVIAYLHSISPDAPPLPK
jgi:cytochrome c